MEGAEVDSQLDALLECIKEEARNSVLPPAAGVALSRGGATPRLRSMKFSAEKDAVGGSLKFKEKLSADMLCAVNEMLSANKSDDGMLKTWIRKRQRRRNRYKAWSSKGGGTHLVFHSLSLPVRVLRNRRVPRSRCVHDPGPALPADARARGTCSTLLFSLSDALTSRRYISKLDEVIQITGRRLVP